MNTDAAPHNVTASDKSFETPDLNQDETATFTAPSTPGRYEFTCTLHPEMTGTLVVEAPGPSRAARVRRNPARGVRAPATRLPAALDHGAGPDEDGRRRWLLGARPPGGRPPWAP
ncbi:hypothetical protein BJF90_11400 [Pseudonocardia sp. CNS-004]|nr:hypothetical protein BJF90_11400 [Pseudonocardia sp. CNS-004]